METSVAWAFNGWFRDIIASIKQDVPPPETEGTRRRRRDRHPKLASSDRDTQLTSSNGRAQLAASGSRAQQAFSGNGAQLFASGEAPQLAASAIRRSSPPRGAWAQLASAGNGAKLTSSGHWAKVASSGYGATLDQTQKPGVLCSIERDGRIKASIGSRIALVQYAVDGETPLRLSPAESARTA